MSIYDQFHLLPPPPPTALSFGPPTTRMRLPPNWTTPAQARTFLDDLAIFRHGPAMTYFRLTCACVSLLLALLYAARRGREVWKGEAWLFRWVGEAVPSPAPGQGQGQAQAQGQRSVVGHGKRDVDEASDHVGGDADADDEHGPRVQGLRALLHRLRPHRLHHQHKRHNNRRRQPKQQHQDRILVPCVNITFGLLASLFLLLNAAREFVEVRAVSSHGGGGRGTLIPRYQLWVLCTFAPLWLAFYVQCWSMAFGRVPGSARYEIALRRSGSRSGGGGAGPVGAVGTSRWSSWNWPSAARMVNTLWIGVPIVVLASFIYPAWHANAAWQDFARMREAWIADFADRTELDQEMLVRLQLAWARLQQCCVYGASGLLMWSMYAVAASILYISRSIRLLAQLRRHLEALLQVKLAREVVAGVELQSNVVIEISTFDGSLVPSPTSPSALPSLARHTPAPFSQPVLEAPELRRRPSGLSLAEYDDAESHLVHHAPLGDGNDFRQMLRTHTILSILFSIGAAVFCVIGTVFALCLVYAVEHHRLVEAQGIGWLLIDITALLVSAALWVLFLPFARPQLLIMLMHGNVSAAAGGSNESEPTLAPVRVAASTLLHQDSLAMEILAERRAANTEVQALGTSWAESECKMLDP